MTLTGTIATTARLQRALQVLQLPISINSDAYGRMLTAWIRLAMPV